MNVELTACRRASHPGCLNGETPPEGVTRLGRPEPSLRTRPSRDASARRCFSVARGTAMAELHSSCECGSRRRCPALLVGLLNDETRPKGGAFCVSRQARQKFRRTVGDPTCSPTLAASVYLSQAKTIGLVVNDETPPSWAESGEHRRSARPGQGTAARTQLRTSGRNPPDGAGITAPERGVGSGGQRNAWSSASDGDRHARVCRGRSLSSVAMASRRGCG